MAHVVAPRDVTADAPRAHGNRGHWGHTPGRVTSWPSWWRHVASLLTPLGDVSGTAHGAGGAVMVQFDPSGGKGGAQRQEPVLLDRGTCAPTFCGL